MAPRYWTDTRSNKPATATLWLGTRLCASTVDAKLDALRVLADEIVVEEARLIRHH